MNDFAVAVMHGDRTVEEAQKVKDRIQKYLDLTATTREKHIFVHLVLVPTISTGDEFIRLMNIQDQNQRAKLSARTAETQESVVISRKTRKISKEGK